MGLGTGIPQPLSGLSRLCYGLPRLRCRLASDFGGLLGPALAIGFLAVTPLAHADDELNAIEVERSRAFVQLDANQDGRLSETEYVGDGPQVELRRRDFKLFDFSGDQAISRFEFAAMPGIGTPVQRGPIPDPFEGLLQQAIDAMDEAYEGWDKRPAETVNSTFFAINFAASLATDGRRRLDRNVVAQADPNRDHAVSRPEAHRFLEIQLGIRWSNGQRLRLANGRVVNFARFLLSDTNGDEQLTQAEFVSKWWRPKTAEADFLALDSDGNGQLSVLEFARPDGPNVLDPVRTFREADTDLDAVLDLQELTEATPDYRAHLVPSAFSAFDDNGDQRLTLSEYRLSMLANFNYPWNAKIKDPNGDHQLTFNEFVFLSGRDLFQLQARFYFHRLDVNRDGVLTAEEFEFQGKPVQSLVLLNLATGEQRELFRQRDFPTCGSPSVSPDGTRVIFDRAPAAGVSKSRVATVTIDGGEVQDLCAGLMPTWSKDGTQFACSRYEGGSGVWIMNADGSPDKRLSDGWGAQWSPDGKSIAFTESNRLCVYDVASEEIRVVLDKDDHPYQYIYWNMSWSPDSERIIFKGRLTNKQELAIVKMTGKPELRRRHDAMHSLATDLTWSPDGRRVIFNMHSPEEQRSVIYQLDPDSDEPPERFPDLPEDRGWTSVNYSPDGKWLVLSTPD